MISEKVYQAILEYISSKQKDIEFAKQYIERIKELDKIKFDYTSGQYFENHHVFLRSWGGTDPKSWNGDDEQENIIRIPFKDHVLVHQILAHTHESKSIYAFRRIVNCPEKFDLSIDYSESISIIEDSKILLSKEQSYEVMNLITHEIYPSLSSVAKALNISGIKCNSSNVSESIRHGRRLRDGCFYQVMEIINNTAPEAELIRLEYLEQIRNQRRIDILRKRAKSRQKQVVNINTGEIFESTIEVDMMLGVNYGNTTSSIYNKAMSKDGCYYRYKEEVDQFKFVEDALENFLIEKLKIQTNRYRKIGIKHAKQVVNLNTEEIFESCRAASKHVSDVIGKECSLGHISDCIIQTKRAMDGCLYQYVENIDMNNIKQALYNEERKLQLKHDEHVKKLKLRAVVNLNTKIVYESAFAASKYINENVKKCRDSSVSNAITKQFKAADGCYYQYKDIVDQTSIETELDKIINKPKNANKGKQVQNIETGLIFKSTVKAASYISQTLNITCNSDSVLSSIKFGFKAADGCHYKYI